MNHSSAQTAATSQPAASLLPGATGTITAIHLALIVLVAIAAVAIIVAGIRRKRLRDQATRQVVRHAEEAGIEAPSVAATPVPPPAATPTPPRTGEAPAAPVIPVALTDAPPAPAPRAPASLADEPIAAAAPLGADPAGEAFDPASAMPEPALEPASEPVPAPAPAASSPADGPITQLKGLGPKVAARLGELGIASVGQLAALDEGEAQALDAQLGAFSGRMARDRWIEQARLLGAGDRAGFEAVFGRL